MDGISNIASGAGLAEAGHALHVCRISPEMRRCLRSSVFVEGKAGTRCLLDDPGVVETAAALRVELVTAGILAPTSVAIQAIAFDKTAETNWKVAWHQDLMFPFARAVTAPGFDLPVRKGGIDYARPPLAVLERLLAVRLHLDDCDETNGPLRVISGSHLRGIIPSEHIAGLADEPVTCVAEEGVALLMRPLTLHASSQATAPKHRRVLHFVFYDGAPMNEEWHRQVR